jgi:hypothetical protein
MDDFVLFSVIPHDPYSNESCVWSYENNFSKPIITGDWSTIKNYFKQTI